MGSLRVSVAAHVGGLPRTFWILFGGQLVNRLGEMVLPFLVFYLGSRNLSVGEIGVVVAAVGAGGVVGGLVGGVLTDRVGARITLIGGLIATAASYALLAAARDLPVLIGAACCVGLFDDVCRPAIGAFVARAVSPERRPRAFGLLHWATNIGIAASAALAGFLIERGFWLVAGIDAATCLLFAVIVTAGLPAEPPSARTPGERSPGYGPALRDRMLVGVVLCVFGHALVTAQVRFSIPQAVVDDGLPPGVYGAAIVTNCLLIVVLQPVLTAWLSQFRRLHVLAASWAMFGLGVAMTGLADHAWQYVVTAMVWTLGEIGAGGFSAALIADLAPAAQHGRYQALYAWAWAASALVGPLLGASLYGLSPAVLWCGCLAVETAAALTAVLLSQQDTSRSRRLVR